LFASELEVNLSLELIRSVAIFGTAIASAPLPNGAVISGLPERTEGLGMDHRYIENELSFLERVLPHFNYGPFPITYWTERIDALKPPKEPLASSSSKNVPWH
jgi:hypothetical protein